ncbi:MAG TPA: sigma-70 family RNA polymerase sigma factor [Thermoanaerobaculia bacterium]|jgi:RNA polymerase sigma-70 factor (ECF subfamily)|nr:sigma-70 family RNA polymerase sigma factor [Thermoanaerobaculia bacterium]
MSRIDELYARYRKPLIGRLIGFGQREDEAADIAQETLIATWKRLEHIPPDREWPYLVTAAFNLARKRHTRGKVPRHGGGKLTNLEDEHDAVDKSPSIESDLIEGEEIRRFRAAFSAAMAELPPETRQAFALRRRGLESKEIAELLGLNEHAVRSRVTRACRILRRRLSPPPGVPWTELLGDDDDHEG